MSQAGGDLGRGKPLEIEMDCLGLVRDARADVLNTSPRRDEDILLDIGGQDAANGPFAGNKQMDQVLHGKNGPLLLCLPEKTMHQKLTAFLRFGDGEIIGGEQGKLYPHLLTTRKWLAGRLILTECRVPHLPIGRAHQ